MTEEVALINGGIRRDHDPRADRGRDGLLDPDAIAMSYRSIHNQPHGEPF